MEQSSSKKQQPAANLTDDLLLEVLSRVPYRSLCRFKCVSRSWFAMCSDPDLRRKAQQTLSGFFYRSIRTPTLYNPSHYQRHHFTNLSGRGLPMVDPSLSFLPYVDIEFVDSCNGLLLCQCRKVASLLKFDYVVCNPATEKWIVLPELEQYHRAHTAAMFLGFDPTLSSHFTVFLLLGDARIVHEGDDAIVFPGDDDEDEDAFILYYYQIMGVEIYSSETGVWMSKQTGWGDDARVLSNKSSSAFFNGMLHLTSLDSSILSVDTEGKTWRKISTPHIFSFIGVSQGHLYAVLNDYKNDQHLSIWVLEDYGGEQWVQKHNVNALELFEAQHLEYSNCYMVVAIHPESSLIYLVAGTQRNLISIDMENRNVRAICILAVDCEYPYLPYIPCYSE